MSTSSRDIFVRNPNAPLDNGGERDSQEGEDGKAESSQHIE